MTPLISRSPFRLILPLLLVLGAGLPPVCAQDPAATTQEEKRERALIPSGDIIYLRDESGRPVPVPLNATLKEYLEWRDAQTETPENQLPEYSIDQLTLTGTADDRLAHLEAVLTVRVRQENGTVSVPLQFNEAVLTDVNHTGEGDFAFSGLKNNTGYEWKISGAGAHEIRLKLSVPLTRQLSSPRLQLTLPPTAVGALELEVGMRNAAFKTPARTAFKITPRGNQTAITLFGLTENLDLSWQPAPESRDASPVLQSRTNIETRMTTDNILLKATQTITAVSGSFQQLKVRLPAGYELQSVTENENLLESYPEIIEGRSDWYLLEFSSPVTGTVSLDWKLSRPIPDPGTSFQIEGFELDGDVRLQSGRLDLAELPGYRLHELDRPALFRTDVASSKFSRAFEFFRQPFSMTLELQKIQPLYSLAPRMELEVDRDSVTWKADLNLSVQRGSLSQISLQWPGWKDAGWNLLIDEQSEIVGAIEEDPDNDSVLQIHFLEPLSGQNNNFSLEAVKDLTESETGGSVSLKLPYFFPRRVVTGETELLITSRPDLNVAMLETENLETLPDPIPKDDSQTADIVARLRTSEYSQPQLTLSVEPRERLVDVTTQVAAELPEGEDSVLVRQSLQYDVRFEGIETLRLRVPASVLGSLSAFDEDGSPLMLESAAGTAELLTPVRIDLLEARTGQFTIQFQYNCHLPAAELPGAERPPWALPLIQPAETAARLFTLKLDPTLSDLYEPVADDWQQTDNAAGELVYTAAGDAVGQEIPFLLRRSHASEVSVTVRHCLHVTLTDEDGLIHTRSDFLLNGRFDALTLRLPEAYELESAALNDRTIPRDALKLTGRDLVITPPYKLTPADVLEQRLTVNVVSGEPVSLEQMATFTCAAPEVIEAERSQQAFQLASKRSQQTYWLVQLPAQQHLFFQPEGFRPQYVWQRQGLFWARVPRKSIDELSQWVGADPQALNDLLTAGGNVYLFSRFGAGENLVLGSMDRKIVVLIGAGLTLLISLMLVRLPSTRNALMLLVIASVLAFAGIWYPTAVALLLQPAILGFCLASLATMLDHIFRRPQLPAVVTFDDPTAGSSQVAGLSETSTPLSQLDLGLGSEDPTQMKPREVQEEPMSSHFSSGE